MLMNKTLYRGKNWTVGLSEGREILKLSSGIIASVMVIAVNGGDQLVLIRKRASAMKKDILVLPGGKVEIGEEPVAAAKREFEEETGLVVEELRFRGKLDVFPDCVIGETLCYWGQIVGSGKRGGDDVEKVRPELIKVTRLREMIKNGELSEPRTVAFLENYFSSATT